MGRVKEAIYEVQEAIREVLAEHKIAKMDEPDLDYIKIALNLDYFFKNNNPYLIDKDVVESSYKKIKEELNEI